MSEYCKRATALNQKDIQQRQMKAKDKRIENFNVMPSQNLSQAFIMPLTDFNDDDDDDVEMMLQAVADLSMQPSKRFARTSNAKSI